MQLPLDRTQRLLLTIVCAGVLGSFGGRLVQQMMHPLTLLLLGAALAFMLTPVVDRFQAAGLPRLLAIVATYLLLLCGLFLLGFLLIAPFTVQLHALVERPGTCRRGRAGGLVE